MVMMKMLLNTLKKVKALIDKPLDELELGHVSRIKKVIMRDLVLVKMKCVKSTIKLLVFTRIPIL